MRRLLLIFLAILVAPLWADEQPNKSAEQIAAEYSSSVVLIVRELPAESIGLGTGFFVAPDVVATNFHVIKGSNKVFLKLADGTILESDFLFGFDEDKDLALIKLPSTQEVQPIPLGDSDSVKQGESIVVISNPKGILENTVSNGLVSAIRKVSDRHTIFQISAPISPGSSGGPVFNSQGQAIGVVVATIKEGQNLNFAVPTAYVKQLLSEPNPTKLAEILKRPPVAEETFSATSMDGSWTATYADAISSGKLYFNLVQLSDGQVVGTYTSSEGGGGKIRGTLAGNVFEFELRQANVDCPGTYTGKMVTDGERGFGSYTGYSCFGDHGEGTVTLARSESAPAPSPPVLAEEPIRRARPCPISIYVIGIDQNDGTQGSGWLTRNMKKWWNKTGQKKYPDICFVDNEAKSHYTLAWKTSSYSVPMYNQESGAVTGYWGHSDVRVTVYNPYSNTLLFTSSHHGRWRWSKPDKDAFKDAIEFMDRTASTK